MKIKGITTVDQAAADDNAFRSGAKGARTVVREEVIPEWFKERKQKQALVQERAYRAQGASSGETGTRRRLSNCCKSFQLGVRLEGEGSLRLIPRANRLIPVMSRMIMVDTRCIPVDRVVVLVDIG